MGVTDRGIHMILDTGHYRLPRGGARMAWPFSILKWAFRDSSKRRDGSKRVPIACVFVNA